MQVSRRSFLQAAMQLGAAVTGAPAVQAANLLNQLAGSPLAPDEAKILGLLKRRQQLLTGGAQEKLPGLEQLWSNFRAELQEIKERHLAPVGWDVNLMTPAETRDMTLELAKAGNDYRMAGFKIEHEIGVIDHELYQKPNLVSRVLGRSANEVDAITRDDVELLMDGAGPKHFKAAKESWGTINGDVRSITREVQVAGRGEKPADWKEKRRAAQQKYLRETLEELAANPKVSIDSRLSRGYGPDTWVVATSMHSSEIDGDEDQKLSSRLRKIKSILEEQHPEHAGRPDPFVTHARPRQPGYGEHDCERLTITNPDFALREMLRAAENTYLKRKNALNQSRNAA